MRDAVSLERAVRRWHKQFRHRPDELPADDSREIWEQLRISPSEGGRVLTQQQLLPYLEPPEPEPEPEPKRMRLWRYRTGAILDPLGDSYLDGYWVGRLYISTAPDLLTLQWWVTASENPQIRNWRAKDDSGRIIKTPEHLRPKQSVRGNVGADDLIHVEINIRGLGACKLVFRNRGWLHVFDSEGREHTVRVYDVDDRSLLPRDDEGRECLFWPFSLEELVELRCVPVLHDWPTTGEHK